MKKSLNIVWFKKDLRIHDHAPLFEACNSGSKVMGLYINETDLWKEESQSERHKNFAFQCVMDLAEEFESHGKKLTIMDGDAVDVFNWLHERNVTIHIWSHEETGNLWSFERDKRVAHWCKINGVQWTEFPSNGVVRKLPTRDGWSRIWDARMSQPLVELPNFENVVSSEAGIEISCDNFSYIQKGGRKGGQKTLDDFLSQRAVFYRGGISSPLTAVKACSRLSPYLTWGCLSVKEVVFKLSQREAELKLLTPIERKGWLGSLRDFKSRLYWHCHFIQKLEIMPDIETRNIHSAYDGLRENDHNEHLYQAWKAGRTGFPFVDACMRYLNKYGWINFRMRAMLVSFATQNLWLHWKPVALHLGKQFIDFEPGIHYSQIQMQAGTTGINAPRIYNPIKQSVDQDPKGEFIRQNVSELKNCIDAFIHRPWESSDLFAVTADYPRPVIDYISSYSNAKSKLASVRKVPGFKEEAESIRELIASRKK